MRFHFPSFLLGYAAGAGTVVMSRALRPLLVEVGTAAYRIVDALSARLAMRREDLEDLFAEAKARARGGRPAPAAPQAQA